MPTPSAASTFALWHQTTWKQPIVLTLWQRSGITPPSRTYTLTNTQILTGDTDPMTKKYFPNNYNKIAKCPAEWFEPMEYDLFMDWKMNDWQIMESHDCIIRTRNCKTGKVKEYSYQIPKHAKNRLKKIIKDQEEELILCTHDTIQHLKPEKYITENDKKNFYSQ